MVTTIYRAVETAITFKDSGGSAVWTLQNLASDAKRISARYDRGAGSLPSRYRWRAVIQWTATPVIGQWIEFYIAGSDGTNADGNIGTSDAATLQVELWNMLHIGCVRVQTATGAANNIASGMVDIWDRYVSVGCWNQTSTALQNTANVSFLTLTPMPEVYLNA